MTARLHVSVSDQVVERADVDVAVVACLEDERPLRGAAARADWRLCGAISELLAGGDLTGRDGEAALFPSSGGVRAPRVLMLGLGPRSRRGAELLRGFAGDALRRVLGLRTERGALALLPPEYGEVRDQVEELVTGLAAAFADSAVETDVSLCLLVSTDVLSEARESLSQLATHHWPEGVAFPVG